MHSHNYRSNEAFKGLNVVVVGASNSGEDICREVSQVAAKVYLSARTFKNATLGIDGTPFGPQQNIFR